MQKFTPSCTGHAILFSRALSRLVEVHNSLTQTCCWHSAQRCRLYEVFSHAEEVCLDQNLLAVQSYFESS